MIHTFLSFLLVNTKCSWGLIPHRCDCVARVWLKLWFIHTWQLVIVLASLAECGMWVAIGSISFSSSIHLFTNPSLYYSLCKAGEERGLLIHVCSLTLPPWTYGERARGYSSPRRRRSPFFPFSRSLFQAQSTVVDHIHKCLIHWKPIHEQIKSFIENTPHTLL